MMHGRQLLESCERDDDLLTISKAEIAEIEIEVDGVDEYVSRDPPPTRRGGMKTPVDDVFTFTVCGHATSSDGEKLLNQDLSGETGVSVLSTQNMESAALSQSDVTVDREQSADRSDGESVQGGSDRLEPEISDRSDYGPCLATDSECRSEVDIHAENNDKSTVNDRTSVGEIKRAIQLEPEEENPGQESTKDESSYNSTTNTAVTDADKLDSLPHLLDVDENPLSQDSSSDNHPRVYVDGDADNISLASSATIKSTGGSKDRPDDSRFVEKKEVTEKTGQMTTKKESAASQKRRPSSSSEETKPKRERSNKRIRNRSNADNDDHSTRSKRHREQSDSEHNSPRKKAITNRKTQSGKNICEYFSPEWYQAFAGAQQITKLKTTERWVYAPARNPYEGSAWKLSPVDLPTRLSAELVLLTYSNQGVPFKDVWPPEQQGSISVAAGTDRHDFAVDRTNLKKEDDIFPPPCFASEYHLKIKTISEYHYFLPLDVVAHTCTRFIEQSLRRSKLISPILYANPLDVAQWCPTISAQLALMKTEPDIKNVFALALPELAAEFNNFIGLSATNRSRRLTRLSDYRLSQALKEEDVQRLENMIHRIDDALLEHRREVTNCVGLKLDEEVLSSCDVNEGQIVFKDIHVTLLTVHGAALRAAIYDYYGVCPALVELKLPANDKKTRKKELERLLNGKDVDSALKTLRIWQREHDRAADSDLEIYLDFTLTDDQEEWLMSSKRLCKIKKSIKFPVNQNQQKVKALLRNALKPNTSSANVALDFDLIGFFATQGQRKVKATLSALAGLKKCDCLYYDNSVLRVVEDERFFS